MHPVSNSGNNQFNLNRKYSIVVFWSKFMLRYSKGLIKQVNENLKLINDSYSIYFVNTDNIYFQKHLSQSLQNN